MNKYCETSVEIDLLRVCLVIVREHVVRKRISSETRPRTPDHALINLLIISTS